MVGCPRRDLCSTTTQTVAAAPTVDRRPFLSASSRLRCRKLAAAGWHTAGTAAASLGKPFGGAAAHARRWEALLETRCNGGAGGRARSRSAVWGTRPPADSSRGCEGCSFWCGRTFDLKMIQRNYMFGSHDSAPRLSIEWVVAGPRGARAGAPRHDAPSSRATLPPRGIFWPSLEAPRGPHLKRRVGGWDVAVGTEVLLPRPTSRCSRVLSDSRWRCVTRFQYLCTCSVIWVHRGAGRPRVCLLSSSIDAALGRLLRVTP